MSLSFRSTLSRLLPPWLTARLAEGKVTAFKYLYTFVVRADLGIENAYQGLQARMPGQGTPTALPYIGRDRLIRRAIDESDESFAGRLVTWREAWRGAGNPFAIMREVRAYCAPAVPKVRIVNASGTWYTLNPDDTIEIVQTWGAINWVWDEKDLPNRFWLIIYTDDGPWDEGPAWGDDGTEWDTTASWGSTATVEQVGAVHAIIQDFKSAGDRCENIILAFDPLSFDPSAAPSSPGMPDGTWGEWSKVVAGARVPSRLSTARYWDGV